MSRFFHHLARLEGLAMALTFLTMVALFTVNVAARSFLPGLATRLFWIDEAVRLMMLYLVFLSCGLALQQGRHVGVYAWRDRITRRTGLPLRPVIDLVGLAMCLYFAWISLKSVLFVAKSGQVMTSLQISAQWIYVAPMVGFLLMALRFAASLTGIIDRFSPQMQESGE